MLHWARIWIFSQKYGAQKSTKSGIFKNIHNFTMSNYFIWVIIKVKIYSVLNTWITLDHCKVLIFNGNVGPVCKHALLILPHSHTLKYLVKWDQSILYWKPKKQFDKALIPITIGSWYYWYFISQNQIK